MTSEKVRTRTCEIWLGENDIVNINIFPNAEITLEDANESYNIMLEVTKGKPYPLLIDTSSILSMERGARSFYSSLDTQKAVALITKSPLSKVIGNFFIGLNRSIVPTSLFSSKEDAIEWLKGYME